MALCFLSVGCTSQKRHSWQNAMQQKMHYYADYSKQHLLPDFQKAHVSYPPKQIAILVFKQSRRLELYASDKGQWRYIKAFPIKAASGGPGPKLHQGDYQVPEGLYHIVSLNPLSHYDLSMRLDYPNQFDRSIAKSSHRTQLGGDIFIHGKKKSVGCIAIGDPGIEQLFPLVATVGVHHVSVIIAPDDLRYKKPVFGRIHPGWLPKLYRNIQLALKNFPLPY